MEIISLSKRQATNYKPCKPTLMISIQDGQLQEYPFKERTNHITRNRYVDTLFLYFDDINPNLFQGKPYFPFTFSESDAIKIINFLNSHFEKNDFDDIIIHCQEGISRSHAVALFIAKYFVKNDKIYKSLLNQEGKVYGGNAYVYDKLIQCFEKQTQKKGKS